MNNKVYDRLKWVSLVLLPGLASMYFALGEVWHVPFVKEIVATITILDTFLGVLLGKSSSNYQRLTDNPRVLGNLVVEHDFDGTPTKVMVDPYDKIPIFEEGTLAAFRVKRQPLE